MKGVSLLVCMKWVGGWVGGPTCARASRRAFQFWPVGKDSSPSSSSSSSSSSSFSFFLVWEEDRDEEARRRSRKEEEEEEEGVGGWVGGWASRNQT